MQRNPHIDNRIPGNDAVFHRIDHTLLDRGDELSGDHAADNLVEELKPLSPLERLQSEMDMTVLSVAAALFLVLIFRILRYALDGFAIGNFGFHQIHFNIITPFQPVDDHTEMQFSLSAENGLMQLAVNADHECGIFLMKRMQPRGNLVFIAFRLGDNGSVKHRVREGDGGIGNGECLGAQGIVRVGILQFYHRTNVPRKQPGDLLAIPSIRDVQLCQPLRLAVPAVYQVKPGRGSPIVNTKERQLPHVGFRHGLKDKKGRLTRGILFDIHALFAPADHLRGDFSPINRRRAIIHDEIQETGRPHILRCRSAEQREQLSGAYASLESLLDFLLAQDTFFKVLIEKFFICFSDSFEHLLAQCFGFCFCLRRYILLHRFPIASHRVRVGFHPYDVDDRIKPETRFEGKLHGHDIVTQTLACLFDAPVEIGILLVHFVDNVNAAASIVSGVARNDFRSNLDAFHCFQQHQGDIGNAQRLLHFSGKVKVSRRVENVDLGGFPFTEKERGVDGDLSFSFVRMMVRECVALLHFPEAGGGEEHGFRKRCLSRPSMSNEADIADAIGCIFLHGDFKSSRV